MGSRALGMGGAFVAVANDSSAVWWNPGGLADGPFLDAGVSWASTGVDEQLPAMRNKSTGLALATPVFGLSYYRLRISEAPSTDASEAVREEDQAVLPLRSLSATQVGVTLVHSLVSGVHAGATFKFLRGTQQPGAGNPAVPAEDLLDGIEDVDGGEADDEFDFDVGVLAVKGPVRLGFVVRNMLEVDFDAEGTSAPPMALPRQYRMGGAFDVAASSLEWPLTVAVDADLHGYDTATGRRRVIAVGAEHWVWGERVAIRGGGRFNTVGDKASAATLGASAEIRAGLFVDGHAVLGGDTSERGWGLAGRVSF